MSDWPMSSAPRATPKVVWYFSRVIAGTPQSAVNAMSLMTEWQMGTFLKRLGDEAMIEEIEEGRVIRYSVPVEFDAAGNPTKKRSFEGRLDGATFDQCIKQARDVALPSDAERWLKLSLGQDPGKFHVEVSKAPPAPERERPAKKERVVRASRDGLVSLASLCADAKVEASDVRAMLRKKKIDKPEAGWAFAADDPRLAQVKEIIQQLGR